MAGAKRRMLAEAKRLGMSLARLRALPVSEIKKRIDERVRAAEEAKAALDQAAKVKEEKPL